MREPVKVAIVFTSVLAGMALLAAATFYVPHVIDTGSFGTVYRIIQEPAIPGTQLESYSVEHRSATDGRWRSAKRFYVAFGTTQAEARKAADEYFEQLIAVGGNTDEIGKVVIKKHP